MTYKYTDEELLAQISDVAEKLGYPPSCNEVTSSPPFTAGLPFQGDSSRLL
jgi:hypothetical protein